MKNFGILSLSVKQEILNKIFVSSEWVFEVLDQKITRNLAGLGGKFMPKNQDQTKNTSQR